MTERDDECELGYWLSQLYWGRGIMSEAVKEMLRHAFENCKMQKVWVGYYGGNKKSRLFKRSALSVFKGKRKMFQFL